MGDQEKPTAKKAAKKTAKKAAKKTAKKTAARRAKPAPKPAEEKSAAPAAKVAEETGAPEEKVSVKVTSSTPVKIGSMTCAKGALAVLSKQRADALVKDGKAEIIY